MSIVGITCAWQTEAGRMKSFFCINKNIFVFASILPHHLRIMFLGQLRYQLIIGMWKSQCFISLVFLFMISSSMCLIAPNVSIRLIFLYYFFVNTICFHSQSYLSLFAPKRIFLAQVQNFEKNRKWLSKIQQ